MYYPVYNSIYLFIFALTSSHPSVPLYEDNKLSRIKFYDAGKSKCNIPTSVRRVLAGRTYMLRHTDLCEYESCDLVNSFLQTQQISTIMEHLMKTTRHKSLPEAFDDNINPWISWWRHYWEAVVNKGGSGMKQPLPCLNQSRAKCCTNSPQFCLIFSFMNAPCRGPVTDAEQVWSTCKRYCFPKQELIKVRCCD